MDPVDGLASESISSSERLEGQLLLEQPAVPEDLSDPGGSVEPWVAGTGTYGAEEARLDRCTPAAQRRTMYWRNKDNSLWNTIPTS